MMKTMTFSDFQVRWKDIPYRENSYLSLGDIHPLNLQIGRAANYYKSLAVMNSGKIKDIPSSYAVRAVNPALANGDFVLEFQLVHDTFDEEFQRLCWDMIEVTIESPQPLKDMIARYMTWQKLLQYKHTGVMSFENQKGLLGELSEFVVNNHVVSPTDVSALALACKMPNKLPNSYQCKRLLELLDKAIEEGFNVNQ